MENRKVFDTKVLTEPVLAALHPYPIPAKPRIRRSYRGARKVSLYQIIQNVLKPANEIDLFAKLKYQ